MRVPAELTTTFELECEIDTMECQRVADLFVIVQKETNYSTFSKQIRATSTLRKLYQISGHVLWQNIALLKSLFRIPRSQSVAILENNNLRLMSNK